MMGFEPLINQRPLMDVDVGECRMMGFEPLINQRLLPPTFPRYTMIRGRQDTMDFFAGLVQRLSQFAGIVTLSDNLHTLIVSTSESFSSFTVDSVVLLKNKNGSTKLIVCH